MKSDLVTLLNTLDVIEVHGRTNVKAMANCMAFVEQLIAKCDVVDSKKEENINGG